jgi:hypothetical protein
MDIADKIDVITFAMATMTIQVGRYFALLKQNAWLPPFFISEKIFL